MKQILNFQYFPMAAKITENSTLARRYAVAFFQICEAANISEKTAQELESFANALNSSEDFSNFIANPTNPRELLKKTLTDICQSLNLSKEVTDFIILTSLSRRGNIISLISEEFSSLLKEKLNIVSAEVYSARNLDNNALAKISETLSKKLNKKVEAKNIVDKTLLGGLKVKIGSTVFDDTVTDKLERLKASL